jgi:hypothetical protein
LSQPPFARTNAWSIRFLQNGLLQSTNRSLRQIGPETDGLKGCDRIEPVVCEDHIRHTALQNGAAFRN